MNPDSKPFPSIELKAEDVERIVACYGKQIDPDRKDAILATLRGQRAAFDQTRNTGTQHKPRGEERE